MSEPHEHPDDPIDDAIEQECIAVSEEWNEILNLCYAKAEAGVHIPPAFRMLIDTQLHNLDSIGDNPIMSALLVEQAPHISNLFVFFYELGLKHGRDGRILTSCDCKD